MRLFGLIGYPLGHSFSKKYFTEKFEKEGIPDSQYEAFPIENISLLPSLLQSNPSLAGLNVTIPYKEQVIAFLKEQSPVVMETGACNCIKIKNGILTGYNTDVVGFRRSLQESFPTLPEKALILGTGGASKAVAYTLKKLNIPYHIVSRTASKETLAYSEVTSDVISTHQLIINTTPLGMAPQTEAFPPLPYDAMGKSHCCYDLIYNPLQTMFLQKAATQGAAVQNGWDMLIYQAEESWRIWNDPTL